MTETTFESLDFHRMRIYVNNVTSVYLVLEKLQNQIVKRYEKGKEVTFEHLVKCSTMYLLARMAANAVRDYDHSTPTIEDKREFRKWLSLTLIDDCKYLAGIK